MKPGLLLVDLQNEYFPGGPMELSGIDEASEKAQDLLSFFRQNRWPVFHIRHVIPDTASPVFAPDTRGAQIHDRVHPLPGEKVITKNHPNSFRETSLMRELQEAGIERLVICGAMSHMCVEATTRAAGDLGFECIVVHDACATMNLEFKRTTIPAEYVHGTAMASLGFAYATVMSVKGYISSVGSAKAT
jgi:nicotinamidase-related amidase